MGRALVCEDDAPIRALVKRLIERTGFEVETVEDGAAALERLRDDCYNLVVLDLMMPGVNGYEVIRKLREERPANLKHIIVMSAASDAIRSEFQEPVCAVIAKPFDIARLTAAVPECTLECDDA